MKKTVKSEYIVPMLDRGLKILNYLFENPGPSRIAEISSALRIPKGTTFRILYTLQQYNFVSKDQDDLYSLGVSFITYGSRLKSDWDLLTSIRPLMEETAKEIGESINLGVKVDDNIVILDSVDGEDFFVSKHLIPFSPMYCCSTGKIYLSNMSDEELKAYLKQIDLEKRTIFTISSPEELMKEIEETKKNKIAFDREEYTYGLTCIASGVYYKEKLLAAISVSGPSSRLKYKGIDKIQEALLNLSKSIENIPELPNLLIF